MEKKAEEEKELHVHTANFAKFSYYNSKTPNITLIGILRDVCLRSSKKISSDSCCEGCVLHCTGQAKITYLRRISIVQATTKTLKNKME
jgi:hypothetical protein